MSPQFENNVSPVNSPVRQEPVRKHTRLILLTIVMISVGILATGYFWYENKLISVFNKNQDLTIATPIAGFADWKTYKHPSWNFEIQYPQNWQIDKTGYEISNIPRGQTGEDFASVLFIKKFCEPSEETNFGETSPKTEKYEAVFIKNLCREGIQMSLLVQSKPENLVKYQNLLNQIAGSLKIVSIN